MFARSRWMFVAGLAACAMCCSGPPGDDAGSHAGQDAGHDAAHDSGAPDAGPADAGPIDPEWVSIADGLPSFCRLERANHPERLDQLRLRFSACTSRANCLISAPLDGLSPNWLSIDGTYATGAAEVGAWAWLFVVPLDGSAPIAAYRSGLDTDPQLCTFADASVAAGRFAMATSYRSGGVAGASFFVAPIGDAGRIERTFFDDHADFAGSFVQGLYVSESAVVLWDSGGFFADVSASTFAHIEDAANPGVVMDSVSVFGDTILVEVFDSPTYMAIGHAGVSGGAEYYRAGPGIDVHVPRSDGTDVGWVQFPSGSTSGPVELWTGRFTARAADFSPRRVRTFEIISQPQLGAGMWVVPRGGGSANPNVIHIYDLADGRRRSYDTPVDVATDQVLFEASDRIIYPRIDRLVQFDPGLLPYDDETTDAGVDGG